MGEEWHIHSFHVGFHHHTDSQILARKVAHHFRLYTTFAVIARELERNVFSNIVIVHLALHLEIDLVVKVIVLDSLGEVENDVLANVKHSVNRLWCSKELWAACVLDTAQNLR